MPYGSKNLKCEIPQSNILGIYEAKNIPNIDEPHQIRHAITNPIGHPPLRRMVQPHQKVLIISDDITRKTPVNKILPFILEELNLAGISDDHIEIIVALGTHPPMTDQDNKEKFGEEITERIRIINHDSHDDSSLNFIGKTKTGIPVWINKRLNMDFKIGLASIFPHRVSGFSGGSKIIMPGVSSNKTVGITHLNSAKFSCQEILGVIENPIRSDMDDVADKVHLNTIFNTILDKKGEIIKAVMGDPKKAFRTGAEFSRQIAETEISYSSDIVITDSHPYDLDFWSSGEKGLTAGELAVKKGGTIIFSHPCYRGLRAGSAEKEFLELLQLNSQEIINKSNQEEQIEDLVAAATAIMINQVKEKANVIMISDGLSEEITSTIGFTLAKSLQEAVNEAFKIQGTKAKVCVLKHGSELVPKIITK